MWQTTVSPCVRHREQDGVRVVELSGEIDVATRQGISEVLDGLTRVPRPSLVIDLRPVTFMDTAMLNILCRARSRTLRPGGGVRLVTADPLVLRMLVATRLDGRFPIHRTVSDALLRPSPGTPWPFPGIAPWDPE